MITLSKKNTKLLFKGNVELIELRGLSTDPKPDTYNNKTINNGSVFIEIDTGKIYMYDLENKQWKEV